MALAATVNARHVLESGVTSVRDTGGLSGVDFALRRAINLGEVIGPRMWVAGEAVGPTGGHNDWSTGYAEDISRRDWGAGIADGPYEVTKKVREQHKLGAGVIKILPSGGVISVGDDPKANLMTAEEIKAAVDTAHSLGLKVAAHAHGKTSIDLAVRMGVDSIEHGTYGDAESWKLMKEHGTYLVPTLLTGEILYETAKTRPESMNPSSVAKVLALGERSGQRVADAYKAGVKIAMGSDTGLGLNPREFSLLVKAGLTPIDAILASTRNSAELIGSDKIGTIQAGRYADIVAVNGDPLQDITELERVQFVMKGGVVHKQDGRVQAAPVINP
jgi:imidazolonepropionase-like amidohydrolase